jgi:hypothetical protein
MILSDGLAAISYFLRKSRLCYRAMRGTRNSPDHFSAGGYNSLIALHRLWIFEQMTEKAETKVAAGQDHSAVIQDGLL